MTIFNTAFRLASELALRDISNNRGTYDDWRASHVRKPCVTCGGIYFTSKADPFICRNCERKK